MSFLLYLEKHKTMKILTFKDNIFKNIKWYFKI